MQQSERLPSAQDQSQQIEQAIQQAESKTSAEIVCVVAAASGRYDRPEDIVGLLFAVAAMTGAWLLLPRPVAGADWEESSPLIEWACLVGSLVAGFLLGAFAASRIAWLRRLFTPVGEMRDEVNAKARQHFVDQRVHCSKDGAGLLVYISLYERTAVILGDERIVDTLGQQPLDELCAQLTGRLRTTDIAEAICEVIQTAGDRLAQVLPRGADDVNELPDAMAPIS